MSSNLTKGEGTMIRGDIVEYYRDDKSFPEQQGMLGIVVGPGGAPHTVKVLWLFNHENWDHHDFTSAPELYAVVRRIGHIEGV